jgi:hypothetical protein
MDDRRTNRESGGVIRFSIKRMLIGVAVVAVVIVSCERTGSVEWTKSRGNTIVQSLEQYRADHGDYPDTLSDLCPKYLKAIPSPKWGIRKWRYSRQPGSFYLAVGETESAPDGENYLLYHDGSGWGMMD